MVGGDSFVGDVSLSEYHDDFVSFFCFLVFSDARMVGGDSIVRDVSLSEYHDDFVSFFLFFGFLGCANCWLCSFV